MSQYRPTRWLSCVATWSAGGSSVIRSARSRRHAWSVWSRRPVMDPTRWADAAPASLALVSKQRTCWCTRSSRGDCGIDEPWHAMLVSLAHRTRAAANGERKGSPRRATHEYAEEWFSWLGAFCSSRRTVHWPSGIGHELRALAKNAKQ